MIEETNYECEICGLIGSDACENCEGGKHYDEEN